MNKALQRLRRKILPTYYQIAKNPWLNIVLYIGIKEFAPNLESQGKIYYFIDVKSEKSGAPQGAINVPIELEPGFHLPFLNESLDLIICHADGNLNDLATLNAEFERVLTSYGKLIWTFNNPYRWLWNKKSELCVLRIENLLSAHFDIIQKEAHFYQRIKNPFSRYNFFLPYVLKLYLEKLLCLCCPKMTIIAIKKADKHRPIPLYKLIHDTVPIGASGS